MGDFGGIFFIAGREHEFDIMLNAFRKEYPGDHLYFPRNRLEIITFLKEIRLIVAALMVGIKIEGINEDSLFDSLNSYYGVIVRAIWLVRNEENVDWSFKNRYDFLRRVLVQQPAYVTDRSGEFYWFICQIRDVDGYNGFYLAMNFFDNFILYFCRYYTYVSVNNCIRSIMLF